MSSFTEPLIIKPLDDGKNWELVKEFVYDVGDLGGGDSVIVPAGFMTDFGSVPQALWWLVSPIGKATKAYVLHDWLYKVQERSRLVSDAILLEAMEILGVNWFQRNLIYRGVRMGGWMAWGKHSKENKKGVDHVK